jgi:peptidyl-prolyl cis-trans isomerase B (cyclophilin B)
MLLLQQSTKGVHNVRRALLSLAMLAVASSVLLAAALAQDTAKGAVITMDKGGEIRIEFFPQDAPKTVENFVKLAGQGFYDGQTFHRVEPGFVVQTGDPQSKTLPAGDRRLGTGGPGYTVKAEFNKRKHERGVVAMARSFDPDSAGSQFYITLAPAPFLDAKYTVFGQVVSGMNVVEGIKIGDRIASIKLVN